MAAEDFFYCFRSVQTQSPCTPTYRARVLNCEINAAERCYPREAPPQILQSLPEGVSDPWPLLFLQ